MLHSIRIVKKCAALTIHLSHTIRFDFYSFCYFSQETSLGVKMDEQPNMHAYKNAIYDFGLLFMRRLLRPWLMSEFLYRQSQISKETDKTVKVLHDFSTAIIRQRKKYFDEVGTMSYSAKKKMALIDLLVKGQKDGKIDIDDEGIREEVDTFMFEVR